MDSFMSCTEFSGFLNIITNFLETMVTLFHSFFCVCVCVCVCVLCKVWTGHCNPEHSLIRSYMSTDLFNNRKIYSASFVFVTIHSASFCSRKEKRNSKFSHPIQHHFLCLDILINFLERFSSSEQTKLYNTNTLTIKLFKMLEFNKYLSLIRKCSIYKVGFKCLFFRGAIGVFVCNSV